MMKNGRLQSKNSPVNNETVTAARFKCPSFAAIGPLSKCLLWNIFTVIMIKLIKETTAGTPTLVDQRASIAMLQLWSLALK